MQSSLSFPLSDLKGEKSTRFMSTATWGKKITSGKCFQVHTSLKQCMDTVTVSSNQYNTVSPIELNAQASVPSLKFSPRREKNCDGGIAMAELWDNRRRDGEFAEGIRGRGGKGTQQTGLRNIPPLVLQSMSEPKMEGSARRRKEMGKGRWSLGWMVGGAGCVVSSIHPSTAPPGFIHGKFRRK